MFELHIADTDLTGGSVPVSWCLNQELIDLIKEKGIKDPQVVLITAPVKNFDYTKEYRQVVPLSNLMTYVSFHTVGENKIFAFITDANRGQAEKDFLHKYGGTYNSTKISRVYDPEKNDYIDIEFHKSWDDNVFEMIADPLTVEVPNLYFAKEPSKLEKEWVNYLYADYAVDQCEFRKRRMVAYSVQIPIFFFFFALKLAMVLFSLAVGARNFSLKPLFHPLAFSIEDTGNYLFEKGSYFVDTEAAWKFPLMPLISVPLALVLWLCNWKQLLVGSGLIFGVLLLVCIIGLTVDKQARAEFFATVGNFVFRVLGLEEPQLTDQDLTQLVCDGKQKLSIKDLPSNKRTIKLRFQQLKAMVCKPYSR